MLSSSTVLLFSLSLSRTVGPSLSHFLQQKVRSLPPPPDLRALAHPLPRHSLISSLSLSLSPSLPKLCLSKLPLLNPMCFLSFSGVIKLRIKKRRNVKDEENVGMHMHHWSKKRKKEKGRNPPPPTTLFRCGPVHVCTGTHKNWGHEYR